MRRPIPKITLTAAAMAVVAVAALAPAGADGARLITGKDVKNNSITGKDIKDGSLLAGDFQPGQIVAGAPGPAGLAGSPGAKGEKGEPGTPAPKPTVASWSFSSTTTGQAGERRGASSMTIPAYSRVNGVNLTVTGDFSSCNSFGGVTVLAVDSGLASRSVAVGGGNAGLTSLSLSQANVGADPVKLTWVADCFANTAGGGNGPVAVPSFEANLTFDYAPVSGTPTQTFQ